MRLRSFLLLVVNLAAFCLSGCLVMPTDFYTGQSRQNVADETPNGLDPGTTTREELLLKFGEPDMTSEDETEFWYIASKVKLVLLLGYDSDAMISNYIHVIRFDKKGFVESMRLIMDRENRGASWSNEFGHHFPLSVYDPGPHFSRTPARLQEIAN